MFNKRSFVLGLGIGIIVGAMLLQLFRLGEDSQNRLDEIGQQIEQNGLPTATAEPTASAAPQASEQPSPDDAKPSDEPNAAPSQAAGEASSHEPSANPDSQADDPIAEAEPELFVVRIEPGMSLTETADLLLQAGAIDNTTSFMNEMESSGLRVRAGYFLFERGQGSAKQAAAIVSGKPISAKQAEQYEVKKP